MAKRFLSELKGMRVVGANGRHFGEVDDLSVDEATWTLISMTVRVSAEAVGELGIAKPFWSKAKLDVSIRQIAGATDVVVLRTTLAEFAELIATAVADAG